MVKLKGEAVRSGSTAAVSAVVVFLILFMPAAVFGGSFWEGTIATAGYGVLPPNGLYGASNAFPLNTSVIVTNPENGRTVEVVITKRIEDSPVFIALSPEAGKRIGLSSGDVVNGTIALKSSIIEEIPDFRDQASSSDPEVTPGGPQSEELALIKSYIDKELGGENQTAVVPEGKVEPVLPVPGNLENTENNSAMQPEKSINPVLEENTDTDTEKVSQTSSAGKPEEDKPAVSSLPSDDSGYRADLNNLIPPELPVPDIGEAEKETDVPSVLDLSAVPEVVEDDRKTFRADELPFLAEEEKDTPEMVGLIASPGDNRFVPPVMSVPSIEEKSSGVEENDKPEIVSPDITEGGEDSGFIPPVIASPEIKSEIPEKEENLGPVPAGSELVLKPAEPRPPAAAEHASGEAKSEKAPEPEAAYSGEVPLPDAAAEGPGSAAAEAEVAGASEITSKPSYTVTKKLQNNAYYLQLGAYSEEYAAKGFADTLSGRFPVTVYVSGEKNRADYKVMVGPLKEDESGAVLFNFKAMGYKDAFLRKGK